MTRLLLALLAVTFATPLFAQWKLDDKFKPAKDDDLKDAKSEPAPKGAVVLFDGKDMDKWVKTDGKSKPGWKLVDGGAMEGVKGQGDIMTREEFGGRFKLHIEFRVPYEPDLKQGQGRGNSGVYVQGRYEVQVLDSYGIKSGKNDCAAIYDLVPPSENVCKAPTVWQTYDIEFTPPVFKDGKKAENARMTVWHNGVKVHDNAEVKSDNTTAGRGGDPILLQDHGHSVQYRNVWLVPMK
jgi:Domain of Unknown Function (DUF1080)